MSEQGYRRIIHCHEIHTDECCSDCKQLNPQRKIYLGPPHLDGLNYDYLIPLDLYTCCKHYHLCKSLPRDWWLRKMVELGLKMVIMHPEGGIDYKAMFPEDYKDGPLQSTKSKKSVSKIREKGRCKDCGIVSILEDGLCEDCQYE